MSTIKLITENIWAELTSAVKASIKKSFVAVAYFGQNGAKMLPLKKGSILVVDCSDKALKSGQTCPAELLKLYYEGVQIYSHENLHSKLFVIGNYVYCGSANVSNNSDKRLTETLLKTNDKDAVADAKTFIESKKGSELGDAELEQLQKIYVAPKSFGGGERKTKADERIFYICNLENLVYTEEERKQSAKGKIEANKKASKSRHKVDEFEWEDNMKFKVGDTICQITNYGDRKMVSPIGKLIHIHKWSNERSTKCFCYVEVPKKRSKNINIVNKKLTEIEKKSISRSGKKSKALEVKLNSLWKLN